MPSFRKVDGNEETAGKGKKIELFLKNQEKIKEIKFKRSFLYINFLL